MEKRTRRTTFPHAGLTTAQETLQRAVPDCYPPLGISRIHTLHRIRPDGSAPRILSPNDPHGWYPIVANDGLILYLRWDYVDRDAPIPCGRWPWSAHHANTGGPLLMLDPDAAREGHGAPSNLTPEVCMPESQGFPLTYYKAPGRFLRSSTSVAGAPGPIALKDADGTERR